MKINREDIRNLQERIFEQNFEIAEKNSKKAGIRCSRCGAPVILTAHIMKNENGYTLDFDVDMNIINTYEYQNIKEFFKKGKMEDFEITFSCRSCEDYVNAENDEEIDVVEYVIEKLKFRNEKLTKILTKIPD